MKKNRRKTQRQAFLKYIMHVKPVEETWTGWKREWVTKQKAKNDPKR